MKLDDQVKNDLRPRQLLMLAAAFVASLVVGVASTKLVRLPSPNFEIPFAQSGFAFERQESNRKTAASDGAEAADTNPQPIINRSLRAPELVAQRSTADATQAALRPQSTVDALLPLELPEQPAIDRLEKATILEKLSVQKAATPLTVGEQVSRAVQPGPFSTDESLAARIAELTGNKGKDAITSTFVEDDLLLPSSELPLTINDAVSFTVPSTSTPDGSHVAAGAAPLSLLEMFGTDPTVEPSTTESTTVASEKSITPEPLTPEPLTPSVGQLRRRFRVIERPLTQQAPKFVTSLPIPKPNTSLEVVDPVINSTTAHAAPGDSDPEQHSDPEQQGTTQSANVSQEPSPGPHAAPARRIIPEPAVRISRQMASLQPRITKTLQFYADRPLNTKDDSAWSIMHSILGYGVNGTVEVNGKKGRRTNAVSWMCWNNPCANRRLLYLDGGYIKGHQGPGSEGHPGQFLAMLAQINLTRDYPLRVDGQVFKIEDLINSEMYSCTEQSELTFKLIALSHYLQSEAKWKSEDGEVWDLRKILEIELSQPVNGAACGGTHRIMAISCAVRMKERRGEPIEGVYSRAQSYVRDYQRYALSLQNRDGSFSSDWFKRRGDWGDKDRQLQTTGHILEWLVYSLPRNELSDARIVRAVEFLNHLMTRHRYYDWEVGPRGHALRALSLYQQRVFQQQPTARVARLEPAESRK